MKSELDYCMFSGLKTIKTLESIDTLREDNLPECIYALGRGIFENYMFPCAVNREAGSFQQKLFPRVDEENYRFGVRQDGSVNYRQIIHKKTGKKQGGEVKNSELLTYLPYSEDREIYQVFYSKACQYVHVDVLSAKNYFAVVDPYGEVNPALINEEAPLYTARIFHQSVFRLHPKEEPHLQTTWRSPNNRYKPRRCR